MNDTRLCHGSPETGGCARRGSAIVAVVILMVVAGGIAGSVLTTGVHYARNGQRFHDRDMAAFLADAGVQAATVRLNDGSSGNISIDESHGFFSQVNTFRAGTWGFEVAEVSVEDRYRRLLSTGRYGDRQVVVECGITLGEGNRRVSAVYAHAMFAGNSSGSTNYTMQVGGTGEDADFVQGDVYSGLNIAVSGDAILRLPEVLDDTNANNIADMYEAWTNAFTLQTFTNPLTQAEYDAYVASVSSYTNRFYSNGRFDAGEAYVDNIGNGHYDLGEPFTDLNGDGVWNTGDTYIDKNHNGVYDAGADTVVDTGNGQWDAGEEWNEDTNSTRRTYRQNGKYDPAGGYWKYASGSWQWKTTYGSQNRSCASWPPEAYEDSGDGVYGPVIKEQYVDRNGIYDPGEPYLDDRNTVYDYGVQAPGSITGMPSPGPGQMANSGGDDEIRPPDLTNMFYSVAKTNPMPSGALSRWGYDVLVGAGVYGAQAAMPSNTPQHIFVRNPPTSGTVSSQSKTIPGRSYDKVYATNGVAIDDYFLEDPFDATYRNPDETKAIVKGDNTTAPSFIGVNDNGNNKLYYVDGNVWLHNFETLTFKFRNPGTRITIVAKGNITISDEFYYNANYATNLTTEDLNSTIVNNPQDTLCLIALKNPSCTNSGNVYIGDRSAGTGGSIHALLYAENDFLDNNIDTTGQPFISVFGNMTAGNQVRIKRSTLPGHVRTRLDVTLDERIRNGDVTVPGLPHPVGSDRGIILDTAWRSAVGTWRSWSRIE